MRANELVFSFKALKTTMLIFSSEKKVVTQYVNACRVKFRPCVNITFQMCNPI